MGQCCSQPMRLKAVGKGFTPQLCELMVIFRLPLTNAMGWSSLIVTYSGLGWRGL